MGKQADPVGGVHDHYERGLERDRLATPLGVVEFERTKEIVKRHLPDPPAAVADIGGGPGAYSLWLASAGYEVVHRDLMPAHVEHVRQEAARARLVIDAGVADARDLDLADAGVDAALLLGPLYHLPSRADRLQALGEIKRVLRPGGVMFAAAISRWAPRLHGEVVRSLYREIEGLRAMTPEVERTGVLAPLFPGSFSGYCHRPAELQAEIEEAGFAMLDLVSVEGIAFALPDLEERMGDETDRGVVMEAARAIERVPELLGIGPHLIATARRPIASPTPEARS